MKYTYGSYLNSIGSKIASGNISSISSVKTSTDLSRSITGSLTVGTNKGVTTVTPVSVSDSTKDIDTLTDVTFETLNGIKYIVIVTPVGSGRWGSAKAFTDAYKSQRVQLTINDTSAGTSWVLKSAYYKEVGTSDNALTATKLTISFLDSGGVFDLIQTGDTFSLDFYYG